MAGKTEILGLGDLTKQFSKLSDEMKLRTSRRMVASAGSVLKREAKAVAESHGLRKSGSLIRNIAIKRERNAPDGTEQYHLGVRHGVNLTKKARERSKLELRGGKIRYADEPYYWRFLEFGWVPRAPGMALTGSYHRKRAARMKDNANRVPERPFIQTALKNKSQEAIAAMEDRLLKDLEKARK